MKKIVLLLLIMSITLGLLGCRDDDSIQVDAIIISKVERSGGYYFNLEYELEGFESKLTAQELVTKRIYDRYNVGDTYLFKRPKPQLD